VKSRGEVIRGGGGGEEEGREGGRGGGGRVGVVVGRINLEEGLQGSTEELAPRLPYSLVCMLQGVGKEGGEGHPPSLHLPSSSFSLAEVGEEVGKEGGS